MTLFRMLRCLAGLLLAGVAVLAPAPARAWGDEGHKIIATCLHSVDADLPCLVTDGYGDVSLIRLRFRCGRCGSRDVFTVVSGARHAGYL